MPAPAFDVYNVYCRILDADHSISMPIAAILALTELIAHSSAGTMFELVSALNGGASILKTSAPNPISLSAGCELFIAFVTTFPHESDNFDDLKHELIRQGQQYAREASKSRSKISKLLLDFIPDESVVRFYLRLRSVSIAYGQQILTHAYSRVVEQALLHAYQHGNKRFSVYVTEARPLGLGVKTYESLTKAGIPCTVILDSAVAYAMEKVDLVLVGSEAVLESGGLANAVGSYQIALIAKAANIPFYALAESYKFHRTFPLSQYDLPTHHSKILSFPDPSIASTPIQASSGNLMSKDQLEYNPGVDYTKPDLITLVFSDVGILTPEGVSQYLVGMFTG
ncbi:hypothetical protein M422DRAFT_252371 [Sphaerobolus stellatus SS14]|uniref:Translation initiation factor eIF2B subunit alpha n=1 Tax=Sphaerobolus stellatus (strain SS14) TaxID=990650 RepID=A0A0C9VZ55_SPHS4|nr:hypothetical protein M422DRAFT_252371 [Sphaerobolus stellatus SS14]